MNLTVFMLKVAFLDREEINIMKEQLKNNFTHHPPKEGQVEKYVDIRNEGLHFANLIDGLCPNSREKSLAITKIEEAVFWANASIARN